MRERERERQRETKRDRERQTGRQTDRAIFNVIKIGPKIYLLITYMAHQSY